ncbi:MAG: hypothetical protein Unbinned2716contig1004_2 [Prokaryotic dsDNA virus sp.]|nr:MAG: hypothetical protein Unbinned2716contig1004_2 [Prokaryotic dsDNA virus sp.]|tara:strand:- start:13354 stop:15258 length:1905 start_codon:yes stop_codon:yes gene_type:complete
MLDLPKKFERDIQGAVNYLIPLVIIDNKLRLSTTAIKFDNKNYDPLLNSLGSIKQSVDVQSNKFQISSVTFKLHNIDYNDVRVIDTLFTQEIVNKPVKIYIKSQSAETLSECLLLYTGYIKGIRESKDVISIAVEDKSEQTLAKEVPDHFTERSFLPTKHQDKIIPIVYGYKDKAPLVFDSKVADVGSGEMEARADYHYIKSTYVPHIFNNGVYVRVRSNATQLFGQREGTVYANMSQQQYTNDTQNKVILFDRELKQEGGFSIEGVAVDGYEGSPPAFNIIEVEGREYAEFMGGSNKLDYEDDGSLDYGIGVSFTRIDSFNSSNWNQLAGWWSEGNVKTIVDSEGIRVFPLTFGTDTDPYPTELVNNWFFGMSRNIYLGWARLYGQNMLSFGGGGFVKSGDILKDLTTSDGDKQDFEYYVKLEMGSAECGVLTYEGDRSLPVWWVQHTKGAEQFWNVKADALEQYGDGQNTSSIPQGQEMVVTTGFKVADFSGVKNLESNNQFVLGDRYWDEQTETFKLDTTIGGEAAYFDFRNMKWVRRAVVKDFQDQELFAQVEGRVDNINLRYTSTQDILNTEQMRAYDNIGQRQQVNVVATQSMAQPKRRPVKQQKTAIKGKTKTKAKPKTKIPKGKGY